MRYLGGKSKLAKKILPFILKNRKPGQYYVEPFAGAMNVIEYVEGNRIANDLNYNLICLYQALQDGYELPTTISEDLYKEIKANPDHYNPALLGFVSFGCSFGGKEWGGFAQGENRNYSNESYRKIMKQTENLKGTIFKNLKYQDLEIPPNSIIYCDPPYKGTTKYKQGIDYNEFYDWCRQKKQEGHQVFVSEFEMPDDFKCIWELERKIAVTNITKAKVKIEKLFIL